MRYPLILTVALIAVVRGALAAEAPSEPPPLRERAAWERAFHLERVEGRLDEASARYRAIAAAPVTDRNAEWVRASVLRLAVLARTLGNGADLQAAYHRLVYELGARAEEVELVVFYPELEAATAETVRAGCRALTACGFFMPELDFDILPQKRRSRMAAAWMENLEAPGLGARYEAVEGLGALHWQPATERLRDIATGTSSVYVPRWVAVRALARLDNMACVQDFMAWREDEDPDVRAWARAGLCRLTGDEFGGAYALRALRLATNEDGPRD